MNKHVVKFIHTGVVLNSAKPTKSKTVPTCKGGKKKTACVFLRETSNLHVCFQRSIRSDQYIQPKIELLPTD